MKPIKKIQEKLKDLSPWFQDEMRFGTRTILAKKWTTQGHRPSCEMKYAYSYYYLFQAIQPATGKTFELFMPNMSGDCFKLFMDKFTEKHPNQTMIMDNAGSHHINWEEDEKKPNVRIEYLSPYSPDYNPQERMFQELKKPLKGKVFQNTPQIEQILKIELEKFWKQPEKVKELTAWK